MELEKTYNAAADLYDHPAVSFWDRYGRRTVDRLSIVSGMTVLDVCCGMGASAIPAAERVGSAGHVIAVDLAEKLLNKGFQRAREQGLTNIEFRRADLESLPFPDRTFDAVLCVFGIFFVTDLQGAIRELWRLVRPNGLLAITIWGRGLFEPTDGIFWEAVRREDPELYRSIKPWSKIFEPDPLRALLLECGVSDPGVVAEPGWHPLRAPEDWWTIVLGSGYRSTVEALSPLNRERVRIASIDGVRRADIRQIRTEVYRLLEPHNLSLLDVAREYLDAHQRRFASIPFGRLLELYLEAKKNRSKEYLTQLRWFQKRTEPIHVQLASDITVRDLDKLLKGEKPTVKNAFMRYLRAVFNWGVKRDYLASNPITKMDFEQVTKGPTQVFEPELVKAILNDCLQNNLALLPYRLFGFFCGVRPRGELPRLDWSALDWQDKILTLPAEITKTHRLRFVDVSENALQWLQEYRRGGGKTSGPVVAFTEHELRERHRENWLRVVGVTKDAKPRRHWIKQGMRHSFCSY